MADEYIRRGDALRGVELFQCGWAEIEAVQADYIERLPAADVVEVVRCKDCKNYRTYRTLELCARNAMVIGGKETVLSAICGNDFCSYGKRRENDGG